MNERIRKQISVELEDAESKFCNEHSYGDVVLLYDDFLEELYTKLSEKYHVDSLDVREIWMDNVIEQI